MSHLKHYVSVCQYGTKHTQCRCPSTAKEERRIDCPMPSYCLPLGAKTLTDYPTMKEAKTTGLYPSTDTVRDVLEWLTQADMIQGHMGDTPKRFAKMMRELTTPEEFEFTVFASDLDEMVVVDSIRFYTLCAHHLLPFFGEAHIAYIPNGTIAGLSKFARVVRYHASGLNVQEELTDTIAQDIERHLSPLGTAVVMEAEHLCMTMRGIRSPGAKTTTSSMKGVFADHSRQARSEFLSLIGKGQG